MKDSKKWEVYCEFVSRDFFSDPVDAEELASLLKQLGVTLEAIEKLIDDDASGE